LGVVGDAVADNRRGELLAAVNAMALVRCVRVFTVLPAVLLAYIVSSADGESVGSPTSCCIRDAVVLWRVRGC
jgi:hypothetical protein